MVWSNLIIGARSLHIFAIAYVNVVNSIANFVESTTQTNTIKKEAILNQYSTKQGIQYLGKKLRLQRKNNCTSLTTPELVIQRSLATSLMNNEGKD